jgi:hypothetical protein
MSRHFSALSLARSMWRRLFTAAPRRTPIRRPRPIRRPGLEALEDRTLLSVSATLLGQPGATTLVVQGDSQPDVIRLSQGPGAGQVSVLVGGQALGTFSEAGLNQIQVLGQSGGVSLGVDANLSVPSGISFVGGTGASTLTLLGGPGDVIVQQQSQGADGSVALTNPSGTLDVVFQNLSAPVQVTGIAPLQGNAPEVLLGNGLQSLTQWGKGLLGNLPSTSLPLASLGSALDSATGAAPGASGLLRRLFTEGTGAIDLGSIGTTVTDPQAIRGLLDGLDATPGNVVLAQSADGSLRFDVQVTKTLDGMAPLAVNALGGALALSGNVNVSADASLHLVFGVDAGGFYVDTTQSDPQLTVGNFQLQGDVQGGGAFSLISVGLSGTSLVSNVALTARLQEPADPFGKAPDGKIRTYELNSTTLGQVQVALTGQHASNPAVNDMTLSTTLVVSIPGLAGSYPVTIAFPDVSNPAALPIVSGSGLAPLTSLVGNIESTIASGLAQVQSVVAGIDSSSLMTTPIPILPGGASLGSYFSAGGTLNARLVTPVQQYFASLAAQNNQGTLALPTPAGIDQALQQANGLPATFGPGITVSMQGSKLVVHFPFSIEQDYSVGLNLAGLGLGNQLNLPSPLQLVADAGANATLQVIFGFNVDFGVDFSQIAQPAQAFFLTVNQNPAVTAQIVAPTGGIGAGLELDAGSIGKVLGIGAQLNGSVNGAGALLLASLTVQFANPTMTLATLSTNSLTQLATLTPVAQLGLSIPLSVSLGGQSVSALLPSGAPPTFSVTDNLLSGNAPTVQLQNASQFQHVLSTALLFDLVRDPSALLDGIDSTLGTLQGALNDQFLDQNLPLVGTHLQDGAQFIQTFRTGLLAELRQVVGQADNGLFGLVQQGLYQALGPANLNLLVDATGNSPGANADLNNFVVLTYPDDHTAEFDVHLHKAITFQVPVGLNLGGLAFNFITAGMAQVTFSWDFYFGFGVTIPSLTSDPANDVFFDTQAWKAFNPNLDAAHAHDFLLNATVTTPGLRATAQLGVLQVSVADSQTSPSNLTATLLADLAPGTTDPGRLTLADLANGSVLQAALTADANVNFHLTTTFDTSSANLLGLGAAVFPTVNADMGLTWSFGLGDIGTSSTHAPVVSFTNVDLDLGSLFSGLIDPMITSIREVTEPLQPVIDALNKPVPVINDLAQQAGLTNIDGISITPSHPNVTFLDLLVLYAQLKGYDDPTTFINDITLINTIALPAPGTDVNINLGSFVLGDARDPNSTPAATAPAVDPTTQADSNPDVSHFLCKLSSIIGLPILSNPGLIFNLLAGKDPQAGGGAPSLMATFSLPYVKHAGLDFTQDFPLIDPIVAVGVGGGFTFAANLKFGYDTSGLHEYFTDPARNKTDLLDGFYVSNRENADGTGNDVPQLTFTGNLHVDLNLGFDPGVGTRVVAGAEGGVTATVYLHLLDPNQDGHVRLQELLSNIQQGAQIFGTTPPSPDALKAVSTVFDASGEIDGYLDLYVKAEVAGISVIPGHPDGYDFEVLRQTLYTFDSPFHQKPLPPGANEVPPTATFAPVGNGTVPEGSTTTVVGFTNQANPSDPTNAHFTYEYQFNHDGNWITGGPTMVVPEQIVDDGPADVMVEGRILADDGLFSDYVTTLHVRNVAPTANFTATPTGGGYLVNFANGTSKPNAFGPPSTGDYLVTVPALNSAKVDVNYMGGYGTNGSNPINNAVFVANQEAVPASNGNLLSNLNGPATDFGNWLSIPPATQPLADKSAVTFDTGFNLDAAAFDPASATLHLTYTFWVEDFYDPNNLIWTAGHTAYAVLNGTRINNASVLRFGNWSGPGQSQTYQVLELSGTLDVTSNNPGLQALLKPGANTLNFTFQMGAGSFGAAFDGPGGLRDASRAELKVQSSGTIVALAGYDPSTTDTQAHFTYSYDFGDHYATDHTWNLVSSSPSASVPSDRLSQPNTPLIVHGRISDKDGGHSDYYVTIYPNGALQQADPGGPYVIHAGDNLTLLGRANLPSPLVPIAYSWVAPGAFTPFTTGQNPTVSWATLQSLGITGPGTYPITFYVTYDDPTVPFSIASVSSTAQVVVLAQPTIAGPATTAPGARYGLTLVHQDTSNPIAPDVVQSWNINWGDGQTGTAIIDNSSGTPAAYYVEPHRDASGQPATVAVQLPLRSKTPSNPALIGQYYSITVNEPVLDRFGNVVRDSSGNVEYAPATVPGLDSEGYLQFDANGFVAYAPGILPVYDVTPVIDQAGTLVVSHTYASVGQYTIHAQATTALGTQDASPDLPVTVSVPAPLLSIQTSTPFIREGQGVALSGSVQTFGSSGPLNFVPVVEPYMVTVNWGDGSPVQQLNLPAGTQTFGNDPLHPLAHVYLDNPTPQGAPYIITVTATGAGGTTTRQAPVTVSPVPPTVLLTAPPSSAVEGSPITIGAVVIDPSPIDTAAGFTYAWTVTKSGAAQPFAAGSTPNFTFTPDDNGTYVVRVLVTDKDGGTGGGTEVVTAGNAPPAAAILVPAKTSLVGTPITLVGSVTDPSPVDTAAGFRYAWSVTRNGAPYAVATPTNGAAFTFTPDTNGTYTISLVVTDKDGGSSTAVAQVNVLNATPSATITGVPAAAVEGAAITLGSNVSDPSPIDTAAGFTYAWSVMKNGVPYASGTPANGASFSFTPDDNGTYAVSLAVTDKDGGSSIAVAHVNVLNAPPAATITGVPSAALEGAPITLGSNVSDPSPIDTAAGFTFAWSVTKNGVPYATGTPANGATFTFTPNDNGTYAVSLVVTDKDGGSSLAVAQVNVLNAPPSATITGLPSTPVEGAPITLGSSVSDPSPVDTAAGFSYAWSVMKNGVPYASGTPANGASFTFTPDDNGTYAVSLVVTDKDGGSSIAVAQISVANAPPSATITGVPSAALEGASITLGSSVSDPSPVDTAAGFTYAWQVSRNGTVVSTGTDDSIVFTPEEGSYQVSLAATDKDGGTSVVTQAFTVSDPEVVVTGGYVVTATVGSNSGPQTVATFTDPGGAEAIADYAATVTWGDGSSSPGTITLGDGAFLVTASHTYATAGVYTVGVTVAHDQAPAATATSSAVIDNLAPSVGVLLLDPSSKGALSASGNGHLAVLGNEHVQVDSGNAAALVLSGNAAVSAEEIDVAGSPGVQKSGNAVVNGLVKSGVAAVADPLAALPVPDVPAATFAAVQVSAGSVTLQPGTYVGGIHVSGTASVTLQPGTYYLQGGGLSVSGNGMLTGNGVLIYNAPSTSGDIISLTGNGKVTLSPQASGAYQGITLFQARTSAVPVSITGNGGLAITGAIYAAGAVVNVTGNGGLNAQGLPIDQAATEVIASDMRLSGNGSIAVGQPVGVQKGQSATVNFWLSSTGLQLLNAFNGGPGSTALGNWLASRYANLYGAGAGANDLAGLTNAGVAAYYQSLFAADGNGAATQVLTAALNLYATTLRLGGAVAACDGFLVTYDGVGNSVYNVGANGAAFGVANNTTLSVAALLAAANSQAANGVLYGGSTTLTAEADVVFTAINGLGGL